MRKFYMIMSVVALLFMALSGVKAQDIAKSDLAGEWYFKTSYSNENLGITDETRYIRFVIEYYEENDSLSLVSLGEEGNMIGCEGEVNLYKEYNEDNTAYEMKPVINQTIKKTEEVYDIYMGNNEALGHIYLTYISKDKYIMDEGIALYLNDWADAYVAVKGSKIYRVGTPEDPDVAPVVNLSPYAGQFYTTAMVGEEEKTVTFTLEHDSVSNKLYIRGFGYEGAEVACQDDDYEVTFAEATFTIPVVFTADFTMSLYGGSFTAVNANKFVVSSDVTGNLNTFDMFTIPAETVIRRVGTVEQPWETIGLSEMAGSYKVTLSDLSGETADFYFTLNFADEQLTMVAAGMSKETMLVTELPLERTDGTLAGMFYFDQACMISGEMMSDPVFYISGKDELALTNGLEFVDYATMQSYSVAAASQAVAVRVDEIPSDVICIEKDTEKAGAIYDLMGRRVYNPVKGQLYIQAGKKFIAE